MKSILDNPYGFKVSVQERPFYYSVRDDLADICSHLRFTVSDTIDVESDCVDVSLIYRYACEGYWQSPPSPSPGIDLCRLKTIISNNL